MQKEAMGGPAPLIKAIMESKGETVDLVVDHKLQGVTPAMVTWWWDNMDKAYTSWHPDDHISFEWEVPPSKIGHVGAIQIAEEKISEIPAAKLRIRWDDRSFAPTSTNYSHVLSASVLGPKDQPVIRFAHEYEGMPWGTKMRSTYRLPAKMPKEFIDALRRHDIVEMSQFSKFLPELYRKNLG